MDYLKFASRRALDMRRTLRSSSALSEQRLFNVLTLIYLDLAHCIALFQWPKHTKLLHFQFLKLHMAWASARCKTLMPRPDPAKVKADYAHCCVVEDKGNMGSMGCMATCLPASAFCCHGTSWTYLLMGRECSMLEPTCSIQNLSLSPILKGNSKLLHVNEVGVVG